MRRCALPSRGLGRGRSPGGPRWSAARQKSHEGYFIPSSAGCAIGPVSGRQGRVLGGWRINGIGSQAGVGDKRSARWRAAVSCFSSHPHPLPPLHSSDEQHALHSRLRRLLRSCVRRPRYVRSYHFGPPSGARGFACLRRIGADFPVSFSPPTDCPYWCALSSLQRMRPIRLNSSRSTRT